MGEIEGLSWNETPFRIEPQLLLTFHPELTSYLERLETSDDQGVPTEALSHLRVLMRYLNTEHKRTLSTIKTMMEHGEISFDLAWSLFVPRTLLYLKCPISGLPRAARLVSREIQTGFGGRRYWNLTCKYTDSYGTPKDGGSSFGQATLNYEIAAFRGTVKITSLRAYPLRFHSNEKEVEEQLIERGRRWAA